MSAAEVLRPPPHLGEVPRMRRLAKKSGGRPKTSVTYSTLVDRAAARAGLPQRATQEAVSAFLEEFGQAIREMGYVLLPNVGSFFTGVTKARSVPSPVDGKPVAVPPRLKIHFRPLAVLRGLP